jgi:superfamily II DNA helicase RecQ
MAQFTIEIADADVERVLNSLAANYNRPEQIENPDFNPSLEEGETNLRVIDNPETLSQFGNRIVRQFLSENVKAHEVRLAKQQAADALNTDVTISDPAV